VKLELKSPVLHYYVNQGFGDNPKTYAQFGIKGHNGIDLHADHGDPVYASTDGMAYYEMDDNQGEGFIVITNDPVDFLDGTTAHAKTIYWHLCSVHDPQFKPVLPTDGKGYPVKTGDLIGYADNTGFSTGTHLHWGLKPVMPGEDPAVFYNFAQNNGYAGAIDPTPYLIVPAKLASDIVFEAAAQKQREGNMAASNGLFAVANVLRAFGV